jgi:hypothetical protein
MFEFHEVSSVYELRVAPQILAARYLACRNLAVLEARLEPVSIEAGGPTTNDSIQIVLVPETRIQGRESGLV